METFNKIINKVLKIENNNFFTHDSSGVDPLIKVLFGFNNIKKNNPFYKQKFIFFKKIINSFYIKDQREEDVINYFNKIQRTYNALNRFAFLYKFKKAKIIVNTDMILNEIKENDKNVICIYHENAKYLFKLFDLLKIINMSLIHSQNFFADPLCIKNPYNNLPFGKNILYYIHYFLTEKSRFFYKIKDTDLFLKFHSCQFNLTEFLNKYEYLLREKTIINYVKNTINDDLYKDIMNMINAGNIIEAVNKINCNADTDDNIFKAITSKLEKEIHNKKAELKYQSERIVDDTKSHEEIIKKLKEKLKSLEDKLSSIEGKIKSYADESCPICLMDFTNPAVMKCCNNLFCVPCLTMINRLCPMCRSPFVLEDLNVIIKKDEKTVEKTVEKKIEKELLSKQENLLNIIEKKPKGKFLVFSCYENTNDSIAKLLKHKNITFSKLLGSCGLVSNTIDKFNKGEINVLLLNAEYYGSGLNLQMASDIIIYHEMSIELETQIIGRAQRIGRTEPLNVYYLLHKLEKHNVTNPSLDISIYDPNDKKLLDFISGNTYENKFTDKIDVGDFWDSDEEEKFKKEQVKIQKALDKKIKEITPKKPRKSTKKITKKVNEV